MRREPRILHRNDPPPGGALCLSGTPADAAAQIAADLVWIEKCVASRRRKRPEPASPSPLRV